jgi:hypothetical protein
MGPRFRFFIAAVFFCVTGIPGLHAQTVTDTEQNAEALEMIASRMKSLSESLNGLPQPPSFDKKIQLPDTLLLPAPSPQTVPIEEPEEEKEIA